MCDLLEYRKTTGSQNCYGFEVDFVSTSFGIGQYSSFFLLELVWTIQLAAKVFAQRLNFIEIMFLCLRKSNVNIHTTQIIIVLIQKKCSVRLIELL